MSLNRSFMAILLAAMLAGCHSTTPAPVSGSAANMNTANSQPITASTSSVDELNNPNSPLAKRSVYFDFDSYDVKNEYLQLLRAHANYLRNHPAQHVLIQGNTDERGTDEYNLALRARPSEAVLHELESLGVSGSRLEAVSLGKEKPVAPGHDEASWAQNRRADLVYRQ